MEEEKIEARMEFILLVQYRREMYSLHLLDNCAFP